MIERISKFICVFLCVAVAVSLFSACVPDLPQIDRDAITVIVERGENYVCKNSVIKAKRGDDVKIELEIGLKDAFHSIDYADYTYTQTDGEDGTTVSVILKNVKFPTAVTPKIITDAVYRPGGESAVAYFSNDGSGQVKYVVPADTHMRFNTLAADGAFYRDGWVQTGWNTEENGKGRRIGFGSRHERGNNVKLYAEWERESDPSLFEYAVDGEKATVTKYIGDENVLVIPKMLDGYYVTHIAEGVFAGGNYEKIVLPDNISIIDRRAFSNITVKKLYLFDNIKVIFENSFENCTVETFNINAARKPCYSGTYFDVFSDKCDRLISIADRKKIILAAGSSTRFGFDSKAIENAFDGYGVANMGVYAYANMLPEYMIILSYTKPGDILLSTPEFDTVETQFCTTTDIDYAIFAMVESNYDLLARIDCTKLTKVFESFADHILRRRGQYNSYEISAYDYLEDGEKSDTPTYNLYGDYIAYRPNNDEFKLWGIRRACYNAKYFPGEYLDSLNSVYSAFLDRGVSVLFEYSPRSSTSITEDSDYFTTMELGSYLTKNLAVPVIGKIDDSLMSAYYFYGTDNHLSTEGVDIYTARVIEDMKAYLNSLN